jgi:hypothetical protein
MEWMTARLALVCGLFATPLLAHDVITTKLTWSRDISRVFARRCLECHGAKASIPLTTYEQARPWAVDIKEQVLGRAMPPWGAVKGFGDLAPDNALSQEEMLMIAAWVVGGAPEGDAAFAPKTLVEKSAKPPVPMRTVLEISNDIRLPHGITIGGLHPQATAQVESAKIIATLPSGAVIPLVWLYKYDPASKVSFRFAKPIALPAGTKVASSCPLRFALTASSQAR